LDVTAKPFQADPTGQRDSTEALQKAIDFARDKRMVAFFPLGTYRVIVRVAFLLTQSSR
jgi:hypothetical protein